jgi:hypothetical protein
VQIHRGLRTVRVDISKLELQAMKPNKQTITAQRLSREGKMEVRP